VDPEYYRKGIGRSLLKRVLRNIGACAWLRAAKNNNAAINLYLTEGLDIVEEFEGNNYEYPCKAVTLALNPELESWKPHLKKIKNLDKTRGD
jgi:ribosomal protein S18 acetylase RimI-like enzyme